MIHSLKNCSVLGINFNKDTGELNWKPDFDVANNKNKVSYPLTIKATDTFNDKGKELEIKKHL